MLNKNSDLTRISIYVPKNKQQEKPLQRLYKLGQLRDRSLNYMVVEAITQYVKRLENEEKSAQKKKWCTSPDYDIYLNIFSNSLIACFARWIV